MIHKALRSVLFAVASSAVLLTACGGGGGGSGSAPPPAPPTPPVNAAPTARAAAQPASVQEGQAFTLDASASTDPENAALTYAWSQVSGPLVSLTTANQARLELRAPEVTANADAVFRVSVSDGPNTSIANATITFENIAQTPVFTTLPLLLTADVPERPVDYAELDLAGVGRVLLTEQSAGGPVQIWNVAETVSGSTLNVTLTQALPGRITRPFFKAGFSIFGAGLTIPSINLPIIEEAQSRVRVFAQPQSGTTLATVIEFAATQPCGFVSVSGFTGQTNVYAVPRRTGGIQFVALSGGGSQPTSASNVAQIQSTGAMCTNRSISAPLSGGIFNDGGAAPLVPDHLVYNEQSRQIERYAHSTGSNPPQYSFAGSAAAQLNSNSNLSFVGGASVNGLMPAGFGSGLALLFTDGQHQGVHRLVVAGLDANRQIVQRTYSWPIGVPKSVLQTPMDGDSFLDVVVISETSPQAIVFEATTQFAIDAFGPPAFVEIGLGASSITPAEFGGAGDQDYVITYPETRKVRVYQGP